MGVSSPELSCRHLATFFAAPAGRTDPPGRGAAPGLDVVGTDLYGRMPLLTDDPILGSLGKPLAMTGIGPDAGSHGALDERAVAAACLGR